MPYITTGERIGFARGKQEGLVEGELSMVLRLLQKRLGQLSPTVREQIESFPLAKIEALGEALLDFTGADDLSQWLQQNQS
jgi:predicted transposase YdaD